jgi:hypothetical protein
MQFQVPQFIEMEDKLIGPLTLKQFGYVAVGGLIIFFLYFVFQFWLWLIMASIIGAIAAALAFVKYNGRSFLVLAFAMGNYFFRPRFYLWKPPSPEARKPVKEDVAKGGSISLLGLRLNTFTQPLSERRERAVRPSFLDRWRGTKERFEVFRRITGERDVARRVDYR